MVEPNWIRVARAKQIDDLPVADPGEQNPAEVVRSDDAARYDDRYPAGDPMAPTDGQVWAYDGASGGWIPKAANAHSHPKLDRALDVETSQRTVYVSPTGSDSAGDGTSANPWATIQYAINQARPIMQVRNGASAYRIICKTGTYSGALTIPPNLLSAMNTGGQGGVWISSETGVAADVVITSTDPSRSIIAYGSCSLDSIAIENDARAIQAIGGRDVVVFTKNCTLRRKSLSSGGSAAIDVSFATVVSVNTASVSGRLFSYGLFATYGALVAKSGAQPGGSVAAEFVNHGGVIR